MPIRYSCRHCFATSYRQVIQRDDQGKMRASGLFKCTGCSVVFADPALWCQEFEADTQQQSLRMNTMCAAQQAPNFKTGWATPPGAT